MSTPNGPSVSGALTAIAPNPYPWRQPDEESVDIYPGLVVHDGRVSGSITIGQSRLPVWAIILTAVCDGWDQVERGWSPTEHYGFNEEHLAEFLHDLLEMRGEFGRLLLELAAAERTERRGRALGPAWWQRPKSRKRVLAQLNRCVAALEASRG